MYDDALRILAGHGFMQYEISNFARPGYECRHNVGYWTRVPYIRVGVSAALFLTGPTSAIRRTNPSRLPTYLRMVCNSDWSLREETILTPADERYEELMLGLRLTRGVSAAAFSAAHGISLDEYCGDALRSLQQRGLLAYEDAHWHLTRRGMDVQNAILVEIMEATE